MEANVNLEVDFDRTPEGEEIARVCVPTACAYTSGSGAPTLTADCTSYVVFEREVERLKRELDDALQQVGERFGHTQKDPGASRVTAASEPESDASAATSTPPGAQRVRDLMTRDVRTLSPLDELSVADELMKVGRFRHVVVVDDAGAVVGVVSHREICFQALAWSAGVGRHSYDKLLKNVPAREVMSSRVVTISSDAHISEAAGMMADRKIGCLPVVDSDRLVGILTEGDLLARLSAEPSEEPAV